ncbi:histidine phosphatase family protein [Aquamicrobium sp.]|uniref:histidine phosphatase family protein n=1 Tax=Aquamicrobium sp. TaxID=1872579 RepID=UPI002588DBC5|nr:histidine phosphatase family protein [Aquamicrobium sp.]MCK9554162.1 histidine phosphatase family protein [Aquamicrobium sp.]
MTVDNTALHCRLITPQERYRLPAGAKQLILVRHGSTDLASGGAMEFEGLTLSNPLLLPVGHEQARAVAARLSAEAISALFVTPLQRTHQTAAPFAALSGLVPTVIPELREIYLGDWEHSFHLHAAAGSDLLARMLAEESFEVLPNAETMAAIATRIRTGIERVATLTEPDSSAVIFTHGGTIAEICRQAAHSRPFAFLGPENTSISRIVILDDGRWTLRGFNDVAHL